MKKYRIAVIPGDGIGPEVIEEGVKTLQCASELSGDFSFDFVYFPWGCDYYLRTGKMMPDDGTDILSAFDAIYLGAVGDPRVPDHISLGGLLLRIRKTFDQYVNLRPVKLLPGAPCPLSGVVPDRIDMIFVRENTEGEYSGKGSWEHEGEPGETVTQYSIFTRRGCERVMRYAYRLARETGKPLTSVSKGNALNYSMVFWDRMFAEIGKEFPDVRTNSLLVDAASMLMVLHPERFGIVVTSNLFGDILTDLGAAIAGGMGLAAGANLDPERRFPSMFEPIHGSAPDIAGKGIANPLAAIWSACQLLDFFGLDGESEMILDCISDVLRGGVLTPDLGGASTTKEVGEAVRERMRLRA